MPSATMATGTHSDTSPADPFKPTSNVWRLLFRTFAATLLSYMVYAGREIPSNIDSMQQNMTTIAQDVKQVTRRMDSLEGSMRTDRIVKLALDSAERAWRTKTK